MVTGGVTTGVTVGVTAGVSVGVMVAMVGAGAGVGVEVWGDTAAGVDCPSFWATHAASANAPLTEATLPW